MEQYTFHNYSIGLTVEMTDEQTRRLGNLLNDFASEIRPDRIPGSVIWGKTDELPIGDFSAAALQDAVSRRQHRQALE